MFVNLRFKCVKLMLMLLTIFFFQAHDVLSLINLMVSNETRPHIFNLIGKMMFGIVMIVYQSNSALKLKMSK